MSNIKINGEIIANRRKDCGRLKLDFADWIKIFLTLITMFAMVITGWTSIRLTTNQLSQIVAENVKDVATVKAIARDNLKEIEFLKKSFDRIDNKLDKLLENK